MPDTDNDTPASESQPAASATPPSVPVETQTEEAGLSRNPEPTKAETIGGCGCLMLILLALCFMLNKCSCSSEASKESAPKAQIEALMQDVFSQGKRLINVDIFQEDETNIEAGLRVTVSFRMNDYLRRENWVSGIEHDMTNAYASLYQSGLPITKAVMIAYAKTTSSYGEAGKAGVYTTVLRSDEAKKVRWENIHQIDLSKIWETTLRRPDL